MADLHARWESWREARERARLEAAAGLSDSFLVERIDDEFGDVTAGDALGRFDGRFRLALVQAALAREVRGVDERIAARTRAGAEPEELDELYSERVAIRSARLARLGFATSRKLAEALRPDVDFARWRADAARFRADTDGLLRDAERAPGAESPFTVELSAAALRPALDFALDGMRLRLASLANLRVDDESRAGKRVTALAGAPRIPDEVWLVLAPTAGAAAFAESFAAAGAALHLAFTSPALSLEKRALADPALGPAFGEALRALLHEPSLGASFIRGDPEYLAAATRLRRLRELRAAAERVELELVLAELPAGEPAPELGPPGLLGSLGPALGSVDALRAASFGAALARLVRARFGREWWKTRGAGELLKELWNTGATYTPEALARELGLGALGGESLAEDFAG